MVTIVGRTKPEYKRIMGEIPAEMHEKIAMYNEISERPLNVSKAIQICIEQAVRKIDAELIEYAKEGRGESGIISDEYYEPILKDVNDSSLSSKAIHKHLIEMLKRDGYSINDFTIKMMLYPIDKVKLDDKSGQIFFYAGDVHCFNVCSSDGNEEGVWDSNSQSVILFEKESKNTEEADEK